jgi:O-antigen ligase
LCLAAWLLAAGLASASRAGSVLLAGETLFVLARHPARQGALRFAAVAVSLVAVAGAGTLWHRWQEKDPWRTRREIQQSALEMIADRPIWGFGIGTFARAYPAYARFDLGAKVEHAHSDWLEWAAEGGLPYALAWLVVAVSVAKPASRSTWGIGVIAVFLHAFVDYPFARFGISAWTMTLAGIIGAAEKRDEEREVAAGAH